jgi:hypothetical protein
MLLRNPIIRLLAMLAGLLAWGVQFTVVYMAASIVCAKGDGGLSPLGFGLASFSIMAATLLCLAVTALVLYRALARRGRDETAAELFMRQVTALIAGISLFAIAWTGLPALVVPSCG